MFIQEYLSIFFSIGIHVHTTRKTVIYRPFFLVNKTLVRVVKNSIDALEKGRELYSRDFSTLFVVGSFKHLDPFVGRNETYIDSFFGR